MNRILASLLFASAASLALAAPRPAQASETRHTCAGFIDALPATISTQGVWCLRGHLATAITSGRAIRINANNVTVDCNGFVIDGRAAGASTSARGIYGNGALNPVVRNCGVRGFRVGIELWEAGAVLIEDNRVEASIERGIYVVRGDAVVRRNLVHDTGNGPASITSVRAITVSGSSASIRDNVVHGVTGNASADVFATGIAFQEGVGSVIERNIVRGLFPGGSASALGISSSNNQAASIVGNRIAVEDGTAGIGIYCIGGNTGLRNNTSLSIATAFVLHQCTDDDGNVHR